MDLLVLWVQWDHGTDPPGCPQGDSGATGDIPQVGGHKCPAHVHYWSQWNGTQGRLGHREKIRMDRGQHDVAVYLSRESLLPHRSKQTLPQWGHCLGE